MPVSKRGHLTNGYQGVMINSLKMAVDSLPSAFDIVGRYGEP